VARQNHNGEKVIATKAIAANNSYANCFIVSFVVMCLLYQAFKVCKVQNRYFQLQFCNNQNSINSLYRLHQVEYTSSTGAVI